MYPESLEVVQGDFVSKQMEESILQHTSMAIPS